MLKPFFFFCIVFIQCIILTICSLSVFRTNTVDPFTAQLFKIYTTVQEEGVSQVSTQFYQLINTSVNTSATQLGLMSLLQL